ncbi:hypothetical protein MXL54_18490 [Enterobacteriaceae bacterium G50]|nr:hypothetical protein [Enterobacteriaceae bacterium G50]
MNIEIFKKGASFEHRIEEVKVILSLIQTNLKERHPGITLPVERWCYVLLPGRIGCERWNALLAADYRCLTHPDGYQFAIVLSAEELFSEFIIDTLSIQNDFYYLMAFASSSPSDDGKLLKWINGVLNNIFSDPLPPYELLTLECGFLLSCG